MRGANLACALVGLFQGADAFTQSPTTRLLLARPRGVARKVTSKPCIRMLFFYLSFIMSKQSDLSTPYATLRNYVHQSYVPNKMVDNAKIAEEDFKASVAAAVAAAPPRGEGLGSLADLPRVAQELAGGLSYSAVLVDVREEAEYAMGHVSFATLAPLSTIKEGLYPDDRATGNYLSENSSFDFCVREFIMLKSLEVSLLGCLRGG